MYVTTIDRGEWRPLGWIIATDRYDGRIVAVGGVLFCMLFNLLVGQDLNWDARNYHYATVFRLLHREWAMDLAPSQLQTWFNPAVYVPGHLLIAGLPPMAASLIISGLQGLNAPLIHAIARHVSRDLSPGWARIQAFAGVAVAMTGSFFVSEIGTTFVDTLLSLPIFGAILLLLRRQHLADGNPQRAYLLAGVAGVLMGLCIGLKLTCLIFAPAFLIATAWYVGRRWPSVIVMVGIGMSMGLLAGGGWWFASVWREFGNPVFPMANNIFHSPWIGDERIVDTRFLGRHATDLIVYPFRMAIGAVSDGPGAERFVGAEIWFRDSRYLVGLICSAALVGWALVKTALGRSARDPLLFVAVFWLASFIAWFYLFGIARYVVVLEMLAGLLAVAAISRVFRKWGVAGLWMPLMVVPALILSTFPPSWGHARFGSSWFGLGDLSDLAVSDTTIVLTSGDPVAYVQPFLPASVRVVRIAGNLPIDRGHGLGDRAMAIIANAHGPIRSLRETMSQDDLDAMARFGLRVAGGSCKQIAAKAASLTTCALERTAGR